VDFLGFQQSVDSLKDQCKRLMGSLEESRKAIETLSTERDYYKDFWTATNNYQSVMSKFNIQTSIHPPPSSYTPSIFQVNPPTSSLPAFAMPNPFNTPHQFNPSAFNSQNLFSATSSFSTPFSQPPQQTPQPTPDALALKKPESLSSPQKDALIPQKPDAQKSSVESSTPLADQSTIQTTPKRASTKTIESFFSPLKNASVTPSKSENVALQPLSQPPATGTSSGENAEDTQNVSIVPRFQEIDQQVAAQSRSPVLSATGVEEDSMLIDPVTEDIGDNNLQSEKDGGDGQEGDEDMFETWNKRH